MPETVLLVDPMPLDRERDRPHPLQIQAWRAMGSSGRTRLGIALRRQARRWKLARLRAQHPEWSNEHAKAELARLYLRGRS
jgi:hypothetical protein